MNIWDKTKPLPSEYINTFYDYLRNLKELFLDRFGLDHNMDGVLDTSLATADGYHKHLTMRDYEDVDEYSNPIYYPWYVEDSQQLFVKLIDGLHELCMQNSDGIYQLTKNANTRIIFRYANDYATITSTNRSKSLIFDGEKFVLLASGKVYISQNGLEWELKSDLGFTYFHTIVYFNNTYFASPAPGLTAGKYYSSTNLIDWTEVSATGLQYMFVFKTYLYYVYNDASNYRQIKYSSNGTTWNNLYSPKDFVFSFSFSDNVLRIGMGVTDSSSTVYWYTSTDGINFTYRNIDNKPNVVAAGNVFYYGSFGSSTADKSTVSENGYTFSIEYYGLNGEYPFIFSNGLYIGKSRINENLYISLDGYEWDVDSIESDVDGSSISCIAYGNNYFVAITKYGETYIAPKIL